MQSPDRKETRCLTDSKILATRRVKNIYVCTCVETQRKKSKMVSSQFRSSRCHFSLKKAFSIPHTAMKHTITTYLDIRSASHVRAGIAQLERPLPLFHSESPSSLFRCSQSCLRHMQSEQNQLNIPFGRRSGNGFFRWKILVIAPVADRKGRICVQQSNYEILVSIYRRDSNISMHLQKIAM